MDGLCRAGRPAATARKCGSYCARGRVAGRPVTATMKPMPSPIHVETIHHPDRYTRSQLSSALQVAQKLSRGRLVLCEPPRR